VRRRQYSKARLFLIPACGHPGSGFRPRLRSQAKTAGYLTSHSHANLGDDASGATRRRNNVCNTGTAESSKSADGNNSIRPVHTNSPDSSSFGNSPVLPVHQSRHPLLSWQKSKQFLLQPKQVEENSSLSSNSFCIGRILWLGETRQTERIANSKCWQTG
jgi:hypothetical protein